MLRQEFCSIDLDAITLACDTHGVLCGLPFLHFCQQRASGRSVGGVSSFLWSPDMVFLQFVCVWADDGYSFLSALAIFSECSFLTLENMGEVGRLYL